MSDKPRRRASASSARTTEPAASGGLRLIRKYGNRRLYDTKDSHYVTLESLVDVFAGEEELRVVDAVNGEDITKKVLAQVILFEEDRRRVSIIPEDLLRALLRNRDQAAGEVYQKRLSKVLGELTRLKAKPIAGAEPDDELDELRRRLKALEKQLKTK